MAAYYNEIDPFAAAWLRELILQGCIAPGDVDQRSIEDVTPDDLRPYTQCHFFAGIGVWSLALRRAGWSDERPVWTGSCPCQPFSAAGKGGGFADERHLWPSFFHLIEQRRPSVIFGEQVASKDGLAWLDLVQADLEGAGYASGAVDTCAAGFGAPHIRQRLYWVAHTAQQQHDWSGARGQGRRVEHPDSRAVGGLADPAGTRPLPGALGAIHRREEGAGSRNAELKRSRPAIGMADPDDAGPQGWVSGRDSAGERAVGAGGVDHQGQSGPVNGLWSTADWLFCRDGKWRPVEPGASPLANGAPARVGRLRGYGNAITLGQSQAFIEAYLG